MRTVVTVGKNLVCNPRVICILSIYSPFLKARSVRCVKIVEPRMITLKSYEEMLMKRSYAGNHTEVRPTVDEVEDDREKCNNLQIIKNTGNSKMQWVNK